MVEISKENWIILQRAVNLVCIRENITNESKEILKKAKNILNGHDYGKQDQKNIAC
jgi:hypothetical protein